MTFKLPDETPAGHSDCPRCVFLEALLKQVDSFLERAGAGLRNMDGTEHAVDPVEKARMAALIIEAESAHARDMSVLVRKLRQKLQG